MAVSRIEKIVGGVVVQSATRRTDGTYHCFPFGQNVNPVQLHTLEEVARYLRANPRSGVRMEPGGAKISEHIFIDGMPR